MPVSQQLRFMGFCGVDDSVDPHLLSMISLHYPWVEWGFLFRPDLEGQSRYPTMEYVNKFSKINEASSHKMCFAAHLCGSRCFDVINGDGNFLQELENWGFKRVQINATAANNVQVDTAKYEDYANNIRKLMLQFPNLEFIIQCNKETSPISEKLIINAPENMSILYDESCGKGVLVTNFPSPTKHAPIRCGYAGGIGPSSINKILHDLEEHLNMPEHKPFSVWIDMESSLRTLVQKEDGSVFDKFDITKCWSCIRAGISHNLAEK